MINDQPLHQFRQCHNKIELVRQTEDDIENWYKITLYRLIEVCKTVSSKYTRSKVRKALPEDYAYVIEELITEKQEVLNKEAYYEAIINTILELGQADNFIVDNKSVLPETSYLPYLAYARIRNQSFCGRLQTRFSIRGKML